MREKLKKLNLNVLGLCKGPCTLSACVHACTGPCTTPWHWNSIFPTDLVFSMSGKTMPVENKNLDIFLWVHTCTHAPGLHGSLHGPVHTPTTSEFNFFDLSRLFCVSTDYANWKEKSGNFSMRARKNACFGRGAPCSVIPVYSISQKDNCPIMIPKAVLISGGWRGS